MTGRLSIAACGLALILSACTGGSTEDTTSPSTTVAPPSSATTGQHTTLVAFSDHLFGATGLAPEDWSELQYGVLVRTEPIDAPALLVQIANPGASASDVLRGLLAELELDQRPEPTGTTATAALAWTLYSFEAEVRPLGGQLLKVDAAIAETDYGGFLVGFAAPPDEYDTLAAEIFQPVLEAFTPPQPHAPPEATAIYRDPTATAESRVEDLLSRMTIAEKIGQVTQVEKNSIDPAAITILGIGSVLSGGGGSPPDNSAEGWAEMVGGFQDGALATRLGIPLIYGVDAVHGHNNVRGATVFPHNVGLGAADDPDLMRRIGEITAREVAATGIHWDFAPTLAVPQDIRWGRTYEGFGEDPSLVARLGASYMEGLQGAVLSDRSTVLATAKHFIGDGGTSWASATSGAGLIDQGVTEVDEATLRRIHLPPYLDALDSGAQSVMVSYSSWNDTKMHASQYLITDVLKGELGFEGFVLSDWQAIDQISDDYYEAVVAAFNAGIDMNMVPYDFGRFIWTLWRAVDNGDVPMERIDDAVRRILRVKFELGLFETTYSDSSLLATVGSADHRSVAREAVAKSLVLLKNDNDLLPIGGDVGTIFVGGKAADDIGIQSGGWTIEWQGRTGDITPGTTILEGIEASVAPGVDVLYDRFGNLNRIEDDGVALDPDLCIGVVGERPYAEFEGDSPDLALHSQDLAVVDNLKAHCERTLIVLVSGRPLIISELIDGWDAVVAAWLPGTEGQGVADVLFGTEPFRGKLPYTWPRSIEQVPLSSLAASGEEPLFPFGYGLE